MLLSVTCNIAMLCQCHKPYKDKNNTLLTKNNQYFIVVTVAYVLTMATSAGL